MLLVEVQRIIKTLRKTSISSQAVTVAENRNGETQTLPKIGGTELLESQQSTAPLSKCKIDRFNLSIKFLQQKKEMKMSMIVLFDIIVIWSIISA